MYLRLYQTPMMEHFCENHLFMSTFFDILLQFLQNIEKHGNKGENDMKQIILKEDVINECEESSC